MSIQDNMDVELVKSDFYAVQQLNNISEATVGVEMKDNKLRVYADCDKALKKRLKMER